MNDLLSVKIQRRNKVCTWLVNQFVWRLFKRVPIKKLFYYFLRLIRRDREEVRTIQGRRLLINPYRGVVELRLSLCGIYEPGVVEYLNTRLSPGMVVADVGANLGFFTLLAAELVGPLGRVLSFEPHPETFGQLLRNISLNGYENITPVRCALSNSNGTAVISDLKDNSRDSMAVLPDDPLVEVPSRTLDGSLQDLGMSKCDLIKLDIEGAEILVIQGMNDILAKNPHMEFIIEIHENEIRQLGGCQENVFQFFESEGFALFELNMWRGLTPITPKSIDRIKGHLLCRR